MSEELGYADKVFVDELGDTAVVIGRGLTKSCIFSFIGNTLAPTGQQYDKKSGQWFGAVVRSSGNDGVVLVGVRCHLPHIFCSFRAY